MIHVGPGAFLATIYQHLALPNFAGRPVPILSDGAPIPELTRTT